MRRNNVSTFYVAVALCVASLCVIGISVASGPKLLNPFSMDSDTCLTILAIRLPRTAVALLMGGALGASGAILGHGWKGLQPERLLLAGVGIGFFLSAVLMLVMTIAVDDGLKRAILWMSGDLSMVDWGLLPAGLFFVLIGL